MPRSARPYPTPPPTSIPIPLSASPPSTRAASSTLPLSPSTPPKSSPALCAFQQPPHLPDLRLHGRQQRRLSIRIEPHLIRVKLHKETVRPHRPVDTPQRRNLVAPTAPAAIIISRSVPGRAEKSSVRVVSRHRSPASSCAEQVVEIVRPHENAGRTGTVHRFFVTPDCCAWERPPGRPIRCCASSSTTSGTSH